MIKIFFQKEDIMNYKCLGCGIKLQSINNKELGYIKDGSSKYCERCFRIKHYNEYQKVEKTNRRIYNIHIPFYYHHRRKHHENENGHIMYAVPGILNCLQW